MSVVRNVNYELHYAQSYVKVDKSKYVHFDCL